MKGWTPELDDRLREAHATGMTGSRLSQHLGKPPLACRLRLKQLGLVADPHAMTGGQTLDDLPEYVVVVARPMDSLIVGNKAATFAEGVAAVVFQSCQRQIAGLYRRVSDDDIAADIRDSYNEAQRDRKGPRGKRKFFRVDEALIEDETE
jgi:hypothetical protein